MNATIEQNKTTFNELVKSITRPNCDFDGLFNLLARTDFYYAPATTQYHSSYAGGLVAHSLNVYNNLLSLIRTKYPMVSVPKLDENGNAIVSEKGEPVMTDCDTMPWTADTIKIVALFHDISKINNFEQTVRNKKVYSDAGTKQDDVGKYDWKSEVVYTVADAQNRFVCGTHSQNSVVLLARYIPLTLEEQSAIMNHHGLYENQNSSTVFGVFDRYPLATYLYLANMMSSYIDESSYTVDTNKEN